MPQNTLLSGFLQPYKNVNTIISSCTIRKCSNLHKQMLNENCCFASVFLSPDYALQNKRIGTCQTSLMFHMWSFPNKVFNRMSNV